MKELDIRIAIAKSLGWVWSPETHSEYDETPHTVPALDCWWHRPENVTCWCDLGKWTTDLNEAIKLCDLMATHAWNATIERWPSGGWEVTFGSPKESHYAPKDSLPLAICEAYLRVKGLWKDEEDFHGGMVRGESPRPG